MFYDLLNLLTWENFLKSLKLSDAEIKRLKVIEERFVMRVFNVIKNSKQATRETFVKNCLIVCLWFK